VPNKVMADAGASSLLARGQQLLRQESSALLTEAPGPLRDSISDGSLGLLVSRAAAFQLLFGLDAKKLAAGTGYNLRFVPTLIRLLAGAIAPIILLSWVISMVSSFGAWGLVSVLIAPLLYVWSIANAVKNGAAFPLVVIVGSALVFVFRAQGVAQHLAAGLLAAWGLVVAYYYELAASAVERAALQGSAQVVSILIDANAIALRRRSPEVRDPYGRHDK
jgi:hypothetical protein